MGFTEKNRISPFLLGFGPRPKTRIFFTARPTLPKRLLLHHCTINDAVKIRMKPASVCRNKKNSIFRKSRRKITSKSLAVEQQSQFERSDQSKMAITLNNGFEMPVIGLGVWRMEKHEVRDLIINSIKIGYRHFDCAGIVLLPIASSFLSFSSLYLPCVVPYVDFMVLVFNETGTWKSFGFS